MDPRFPPKTHVVIGLAIAFIPLSGNPVLETLASQSRLPHRSVQALAQSLDSQGSESPSICQKKNDRNASANQEKRPEQRIQGITPLETCQQAIKREAEARTYNQKHKYTQAIQSYEEALALYQKIHWRFEQALTLSSIATVHGRNRNFGLALKSQLQAIEIAQSLPDRDRQSQLLSRLTWTISSQFHSRSEIALKLEQKMLSIHQDLGDRKEEALSLSRIGSIYYNAKQFKESLDYRQQAYQISEALGDTELQASLLSAIGNMYMVRGVFIRYRDTKCIRQDQFDQAIQFYQQAIDRYQTLVDQATTPDQNTQRLSTLAEQLNDIATDSSHYACQYEQAIAFYQQASSIYRELGNHNLEAQTLNKLGNTALRARKLQLARAAHQQALEIYQTINPDRAKVFLFELSQIYLTEGDGVQALQFGQQQVELANASGSPREKASAINNLGRIYTRIALNRKYTDLQQEFPHKTESEQNEIFDQRPLPQHYIEAYQQAITHYQQVLQIYRSQNDNLFELGVLLDIGYAYDTLRQDDQASRIFQEALDLERRRGNREDEAHVLEIIGKRDHKRGQYQAAIQSFKQASAIYQDLNDPLESASILAQIGSSHRQLREYQASLNAYHQSYELYQKQGLQVIASWRLKSMGEVSLDLDQPQQALDYFQQAAELVQNSNEASQGLHVLVDIGQLYLERKELPLALKFHRQYLNQIKAEGDRLKEVSTLNRFGRFYHGQGQPDQALGFYRQAVEVSHELQQKPEFKSFDGKGIALSGIGDVMATQQKPALAIVFHKAAINHFETIRESYTGSSVISDSDFSRLFLDQHVESYRSLADILLQQDRILEAQQVLDLLKVQELDDYLKNVRGNTSTAQGIEVLRPEQTILSRYNQLQASAIELGQELRELEKIPESKKKTRQKRRQAELAQLEIDLNAQFNDFIDSEELQALVSQLTRSAQQQNLNLEDLTGLSDNLEDYNAALLYPLILDDRLELILTTPNSPPLRRTVVIPKEKLNQAIQFFREQLTTRDPMVKNSAQQLYRLLIKPIEADLKQAGVDTIIYAPDGSLRYIPLAALHDGQQWLTERFEVNHITARSLTDFNQPKAKSLSALAGAFTRGSVDVRVGERHFNFVGLPFAGKEVEDLTATLSNSSKFLDEDFSPSAFIPRLKQHSIIHFATHAEFLTGQPEESFILFGNGDRVTLSEIKNWRIPNVDLVVLSACNTGIGGFGNGAEILGLGYQFQRAGARAAMASLWRVDDGGTQVLMTEFYKALDQGRSKTKALQMAQQAMIKGNYADSGSDRGSIQVKSTSKQHTEFEFNYQAHPYFWAPFILIGNGL